MASTHSGPTRPQNVEKIRRFQNSFDVLLAIGPKRRTPIPIGPIVQRFGRGRTRPVDARRTHAQGATTAPDRSGDDCYSAHESPLRHRATMASCAFGEHAIWWWVEAEGEREALGLLPYFVAQRSTATRIGAVDIP
jgi:hypothetical protein